MAPITLRTYIREIESLIDHNNTEAAIAHCMYILQTMPKHIGTYRMLGKALHEAQRYADAADVFQRVLSVVPDDFVSNVGLSIIRQDEGNMDAAIWHMERAYETQPSNQPIQEELRRLYGRRDGLEPPRVRLTRGALARMYMKGHLYNQAIGELRAALAEDPNRADLQVLLAQASYFTGQKVDAVEVCSQLLKRFPYCLEANRLLALILPNTERSKDSEIYRQRVVALDPYLQKADPNTLISDAIPDTAITLEKLEIDSSQAAEAGMSQPDWAASLGAPFKTPEQTELPEWLREEQGPGQVGEIGELPQQAQPADRAGITWETSTGELGTDWLKHFEGAEGEGLETTTPEAEPPLPDWMKAAGWEPAEGGEKEAPVSWEEFEAANGSEIEQGEIPDWLKAIAPGETVKEEGETPTWLQENPPGASDTIVNWLSETKAGAAEEDLSGLESALDQVIADKTPTDAEELEDVPDWLRGLDTQGPSEGPTTGELQIPEWLQETEPEQPAAAEPSAAGMEWLKEIEVETPIDAAPLSTAEPIAEVEEVEIPDWLKPLEPEAPVESTEDLLSMQTLIAMPPAEDLIAEETLIVQPVTAEKISEVEAAKDSTEDVLSMQTLIAMPPAEDLVAEETLIVRPETAEEISEAEAADKSTEDLLAMQTLIAMPPAEDLVAEETLIVRPETAEAISEVEAADEIPDWLKEMVEETPVEPTVETIAKESGIIQPPIAAESLPVEVAAAESGLMDEDEALAFLASLAAKHDGEIGWLETVVSETMGEDASVSGKLQEEPPARAIEEELPSPEPASEEIEEPVSSEGEADAIAWLETIAETEDTTQAQLSTTQPEQAIEPPAWVKSGTISEDETVVVVPSSDEIPDWLQTPSDEELGETQPTLVADEAELPEMEQPKVDLNTASLSQLEAVPVVGFIMAQNILNYRQIHGSIERLEDLASVPGMTEADVEALRDYVEINLEKPQPEIVTRHLAEPQNEVEAALFEARQSIQTKDYLDATTSYTSLIKKGQYLPEIIQDLQEVLAQNPQDLNLWQTLGDACMRNDQLQDALEAYSHAEELLR